jgi:hypothetical protein
MFCDGRHAHATKIGTKKTGPQAGFNEAMLITSKQPEQQQRQQRQQQPKRPKQQPKQPKQQRQQQPERPEQRWCQQPERW